MDEKANAAAPPELQAADWVRVKSLDEIKASLDAFDELKGCAFLSDMYQYCDTVQECLSK